MSRQLLSNRDIPSEYQEPCCKSTGDPLQSLTALIKCVKDREELYFQLLGFVNRNIDSSVDQIDQWPLFDRFVSHMRKKEYDLLIQQNAVMMDENNNPNQRSEMRPIKRMFLRPKKGTIQGGNTSDEEDREKEVSRCISRVIEILNSSIEKARHSLFDHNNRAYGEFTKFNQQISNSFKLVAKPSLLNPKNPSYRLPRPGDSSEGKFNVYAFIKLVVSYITAKYRREIEKVDRYLDKLESGEMVAFRDFVLRRRGEGGSDLSQESTTSKKISPKKKIFETKEKVKEGGNHIAVESPTRKPPRRGSKQKHRLLSKRQKDEDRNNSDCSQIDSPLRKKSKRQAGKALYKFYDMMQLNRKQFFEDYVYDKIREEEQKTKLMNALLQKNKMIREQISQYSTKTINYESRIQASKKALLQVSSDEGYMSRNQSGNNSKLSLRTSFVISKRRSSFQLEKDTDQIEHGSAEEASDTMRTKNKIESNVQPYKTPKSVTPRRKSSSTNKKSNRIFVVKAPIMFQDDIPKAPVTQTTWMQNPMTQREKQQSQGRDRGKQKDRRRNQSIRFKKRNNPCPLENTFLPENFTYDNGPPRL